MKSKALIIILLIAMLVFISGCQAAIVIAPYLWFMCECCEEGGWVRSLISEGVLNEKKVGSAILCSLNYKNEKTIGLLVLNSICKTKMKYKFPEEVSIAFSVKKTLYAIGSNVPKKYSKIDNSQFKDLVKSRLNQISVLKGHETFWRMIQDIVI